VNIDMLENSKDKTRMLLVEGAKISVHLHYYITDDDIYFGSCYLSRKSIDNKNKFT
jgi:hypothetical protein